MSSLLADTISSKTQKELEAMISSGWNASIAEVEVARRKALRIRMRAAAKASGIVVPVPVDTAKVTRKAVSRGRGHARRRCGVTGGYVNLETITVGNLREPKQGQHVSPWIANATGRGDVI